jgi:hypothetical protein
MKRNINRCISSRYVTTILLRSRGIEEQSGYHHDKMGFCSKEEVLEGAYRQKQAQRCRGRQTGLKTGDENVELVGVRAIP